MAKTLEDCEPNVNSTAAWKKLSLPLLGLTLIMSGCQGASQSGVLTTVAQPNVTHGTPSPATAVSLPPAGTPPPSVPATKTASPNLPLTPSELQEFDSAMLELDPDQQLVTSITQWNLSTTVHVTTGPGFTGLSQERQNEVAIAMRDGLSQVCLCSPRLKFSTESSQKLIEVDQQVQWQ